MVDRLRAGIERKVWHPVAQAEILQEMAQKNANKACCRVVLGLPVNSPPTLTQRAKACARKAELFNSPEEKHELTNPKTVAAATPEENRLQQDNFNTSSASCAKSLDTSPETIPKTSKRRKRLRKMRQTSN